METLRFETKCRRCTLVFERTPAEHGELVIKLESGREIVFQVTITDLERQIAHPIQYYCTHCEKMTVHDIVSIEIEKS